VIQAMLGIDDKIAFGYLVPIVALGFLISPRSQGKFQQSIPLMGGLIVIGAVASAVSGSDSQFLMGGVLAIAVLAGQRLFYAMKKLDGLRFLSLFTVTLLVGGIVGLLYAYFVKRPLFEVQVGYRTTYLYLTTFSFANIGDFIRPSGIFDEPGAFAMYAAIITMFNDVLGQNRRVNIAILILMVFTGSLAGLFLTILYLVTSAFNRVHAIKGIALVLALAASYGVLHNALPDNPLDMALDTFYSGRLEVVDGRLEGDNRSIQVEEFFSLVDEDILTRGAKAMADKYQEVDQSSNPFSIIYGYGLIISIPYFALLVWLAFMTFRNRFHNSYATLGLLLLLLQRPYVYNMMWATMIAATVWLIVVESRTRRIELMSRSRLERRA
jgi:MFS family permease